MVSASIFPMTQQELLEAYGLPASLVDRPEICQRLKEEIARERRGESRKEVLCLLCAQLFSIGEVEDVLLIWEAKNASEAAFLEVDLRFLCGAGFEETEKFLESTKSKYSYPALSYIIEAEMVFFVDWQPSDTVTEYRQQYGLE